MATTNYNLPTITDNMTADVVRDHNALAEAVDDAIETVDTKITSHLEQYEDEVGDVQQLQTTNKEIVSAINEVKQYADDGKDLIATAIVGKGGTASSSDTFSQLAIAIGGITTGKKWASGTSISAGNTLVFENYGNTTTINLSYIEVTGLDFKPSFIYACGENAITNILSNTIFREMGIIEQSNIILTFESSKLGVNTTNQTNRALKTSGNAYVSEGGFKLPFNTSNKSVTWIAYE